MPPTASPSPIPICLITGFLGSGKTTFLKHVAAHAGGRRLVFLVNEFSLQDIDGAIVAADHPNVVSVPGGSIFCKCLVGEFIARLGEIPDRFGSPDALVIEASGMANPKVIGTMLRETGLDRRYRLATIVAIVDPGSFHKLCRTLPNIVDQIVAADLALVNKADLFDSETLAATVAALLAINPAIDIHTCTRGHVDLELFAPPTTDRQLAGTYAPCRDPNYETVAIPLRRPLSPAQLGEKLREVEDEIYRLKGHLETPTGLVYVDFTRSAFTATPAITPDAPPLLVLIHRGNPSPSTQALIAWLRQ